ncbi:MAG: DUF4097 domain-containing protein [Bacteroidales bacterium]|nr:DUF4097 domain-containing protein [Bacteroidales bacterium]
MRTKGFLFSVLVAGIFLLQSCSITAQSVYAEIDENFSGIERIEVEGSFCDVTVKGTSADDVTVEGQIKGKSHKKDFEINARKTGSTLKIWVESPGFNWGSISISGYLDIQVPEKISVYVDNSSGDVKALSLKGGELYFEASSGNVQLSAILSNLKAETSSGNIKVEQVKGNINAESTSGDQRFSNVKGNIETYSSSGDLKFNQVMGNIKAESSSGDHEYRNVEGRLNLEASSGDIEGEGVNLTGDSRFETSSGDIKFDLTNDIEDLSFDLRASSGDLRVGRNKAEDNFNRSGGRLLVKGVSSSGDQTYH